MKRKAIILFLTVLILQTAIGKVKLPKLISDGMVLQRDAMVKIWGWAEARDKVTLSFNNSITTTIADDSGRWAVTLPQLKAGGPYTMMVYAGDTLTIQNILVGDVWVCSGQSNMELPMKRVSPLYESEIANSENTDIRCFTVPQKYNFTTPQDDLDSGSWQLTTPKTILNFSATAYFFAKELYDKYHVPIGLIQTSLGGSPAQAWMSEEALKMFPEYYKEAQRFKDSSLITKIENADKVRIQAWYNELGQKDEGYKDAKNIWHDTSLSTSDWSTMKIPGYWANTALGPVNGVVWFRKEFDISSSQNSTGTDSPKVGQQAKLILGRIVDADSVFVNGCFVGTTGYQYPPRRYDFPSRIIKEGKNNITVRVISNIGKGGFVLDKQYELLVGGRTYDLTGDWQYRLGATMDPLASQTFIRWKPLGLYNAMISPLLNYSMKGVIWYQGESNAERPLEYRELFPALIRDWRKNWKQGNFPFLFVQLPNFMEAKELPSESNWALLRDAQLQTLSLPRTGMAVAIDIGEWNDIHPLNKKDVGKRLALAAQKVAYNDKNVVASGPTVRSMKMKGRKIILTFTHVGSGLVAKGGGELTNFAVAGSDKKFVWANTRIKGAAVEVWNNKIQKPVAVRYAWADNPSGANLYNREGLPASPFTTDK